MRPTLRPGLTYELAFEVSDAKTAPRLYPESDIYRAMPEVLATGFMVGLMEWACVEAIRDHLEDGEGSLGVHIDVSHEAATPPGLTVRVRTRCVTVEGRRLVFEVEADDGIDVIGRGRHERMVVRWDRFEAAVREKAAKAAT